MTCFDEDLRDEGEGAAGGPQDRTARIAILDIRGMGEENEDATVRVDQRVALATLIFLPASYLQGPPLSPILADWLSTTAAVGEAWRPTRSESCTSSARLIFS